MQTQPVDLAGLPALAQSLVETLLQEQAALATLSGQFETQLEAVRTHRQEALDAATQEINESVTRLLHLRQARERQTRLLGRLLRVGEDELSLARLAAALQATSGGGTLGTRLMEARGGVHAAARTTRQRSEALEFALQYALRLGREMVQALQNRDVPPGARLYTAAGGAVAAVAGRSLVNTTG